MQSIKTFNFELPVTNTTLPSELRLIDFLSSKDRYTVQINAEPFLIIGKESGQSVGINIKTDEVYLVDEDEKKVDVFVNSKVENLVTFIASYQQNMLTKTSEEKKLQLLTNLWKEFKKIDPKALASIDNTWWGEFLDDKLTMFGGDADEIEMQAA